MNKYLVIHSVGKNQISRSQAEQFVEALQHEPNCRGLQSFMNLSEGKAVCIVEATDQKSLSNFYQKNKIPVDWIGPVELEAERGTVREARSQPIGASMPNQPAAGLSA